MHKKTEKPSEDGYKYSGPLRPFPYGFRGHRNVPQHIKKPDYAKSGSPNLEFQSRADRIIPVYNEEEIELSKETCRICREACDLGHKLMAPGVTTEEIDKAVHEYIID